MGGRGSKEERESTVVEEQPLLRYKQGVGRDRGVRKSLCPPVRLRQEALS
jgi:hypothetical protein